MGVSDSSHLKVAATINDLLAENDRLTRERDAYKELAHAEADLKKETQERLLNRCAHTERERDEANAKIETMYQLLECSRPVAAALVRAERKCDEAQAELAGAEHRIMMAVREQGRLGAERDEARRVAIEECCRIILDIPMKRGKWLSPDEVVEALRARSISTGEG
jgi:hypothetical protein